MKKTLIILSFIILYLITSVPVGLFIYSVKSEFGIDVFKRTGFHGYLHCLQEQASLIGADHADDKGGS